ncbi:hypothetical protein X777_03775 [Ooceraea biroi]|uniref:Uncharacterized protein n=1 Tax=Ooceraea biroi TaxID=2015173 RepID=A0A026WIN9_OOCBI|nr:hypothetical protein X777_03775 [Ooceraea biroi]
MLDIAYYVSNKYILNDLKINTVKGEVNTISKNLSIYTYINIKKRCKVAANILILSRSSGPDINR